MSWATTIFQIWCNRVKTSRSRGPVNKCEGITKKLTGLKFTCVLRKASPKLTKWHHLPAKTSCILLSQHGCRKGCSLHQSHPSKGDTRDDLTDPGIEEKAKPTTAKSKKQPKNYIATCREIGRLTKEAK